MNLTILTPVYRELHPATRASLEDIHRDIPNVVWVSVSGLSCIVQARNAVATKAMEQGAISDSDVVLWLDSDMVAPVETVKKHMDALRVLNASHQVNAIAGSCVTRTRPQDLALWQDPCRKPFEADGRNVIPVVSGMACLMLTGREFLRIVDVSPTQFDPITKAIVRHIICLTRVRYDDKGAQFVSEDFDYCSRIQGGVWCAPALRYGHVVEMPVWPPNPED